MPVFTVLLLVKETFELGFAMYKILRFRQLLYSDSEVNCHRVESTQIYITEPQMQKYSIFGFKSAKQNNVFVLYFVMEEFS